MALMILIFFSIAMGADYSFFVKSIAAYAPTFLGYDNSVLAIVSSLLKIFGFLQSLPTIYTSHQSLEEMDS